MSNRTLKILPSGNGLMRGNDAAAWERTINRQMRTWDIDYRVPTNEAYDMLDRSLTASIVYGLGVPLDSLARGLTPELRIHLRNKKLSPRELERYRARADWRRRLKIRLEAQNEPEISRITRVVTVDSWGWGRGHDGIDVNTPPNAPLYAPVRSRVIDVRAGGWWGKSPSGDVRLGDGIVQLEVLDDVGPFRRGMHIGYGHAEHATVRVGQIVEAGDQVARAGLAVTNHVHWMINGGHTNLGIGDRDPRPFYEYAQRHG